MTPAAMDRVFGRGRLRMVTGDHVEVFREEAQPGERRRYTKRFLATPEGDFRHWTEREWRILARLVGHGIGPVPDVVQFDRGAPGRPALVQTYDAGVTIDHWTSLLPVQRDGVTLDHVFEDCAHWWALARHSLAALDAIHELQLVHLDLKADNLCIPVGPADFDPLADGERFHPDFERIALIDFAFSLVSGERLESALPIARQTDYDYQSPRLLEALEQGSRGNLAPTRQLDWRCDLFSLAAMLRRYLPRPGTADGHGWTAEGSAAARALIRRLLEAHDAHVPAVRPHAALIALADEPLRDPDLAESLQRGWQLGAHGVNEDSDTPTPITRIAMPVALPVDAELITIDRSDIESRAAANVSNAGAPRRRVAWAVGAVALAALSVPLLGEAWRALVPPEADAVPSAPTRTAAAPPEPLVPPAVVRKPDPLAPPPTLVLEAPPAPSASASVATAERVAAAAPDAPASSSVVALPSMPSPPASPPSSSPSSTSTESHPVAAPETPGKAAVRTASSHRTGVRPQQARVVAQAAPRNRPGPSAAVPASRKPAVVARAAAASRASQAGPMRRVSTAPRPALFPVQPTKPSLDALARGAALRLPPAVDPAPRPSTAAAGIAAASSPPIVVAAPPRAEESAPLIAQDFVQRANELMATQMPRVAQRAERMVLRVLFAAANADEDGRDDENVRRAAGAIRLAPDDPQLVGRVAAREGRSFQDAARSAFRRGDLAEAVDLQTRAFGANPVDAEIVGTLAFMRLKQGPQHAEAARRLALHALTLHDWKYPAGRIDDWHTFAIASALAGHERDARNAWLAALALSGGSERQCRAAIDAYAQYGERLRTPVEAMLYRASASSRPQRSRLCEWPPHWSASSR